MKTILLLVAGAVIGALLTVFLQWAQQFGNTASAKAIRDELDRKREKLDAGQKRNNPTHN